MKKLSLVWASAIAVMMVVVGVTPMVVTAAIPVPHNNWGIPYDETPVMMSEGELITSWIDGVEYGRGTTFLSGPDVYYDIDTAGNWVTAPGDPNSPWVKEGGDLLEPIMYAWGDMTNIKLDPDSDMVLNYGVFEEWAEWWTTAVNYTDIYLASMANQPPMFPKISQIVPEPIDGDPDYVFIYTEDPFFDMAGFYLEKNDNTTHGPTFALSGPSDSQGYFYANLTTMDLWGCGDELKLVWTNPGPAFGGMDIVVDRVEWNATVGGCHYTEPDNTIMTDATAPGPDTAIRRTGTDPVYADDTNDNAVDFVTDTPWPRPVIGPPVVTWITPAGGEVWTGNMDHTISFYLSDSDYPNDLVNLTVEYSLNGGAPWFMATLVGDSNPLDGRGTPSVPMDLVWSAPVADSVQVLLRIFAENPANMNAYYNSSMFALDSTPPTVIGTDPADTAVDVPVGQDIVITFDEDMGTAVATIDPDPGIISSVISPPNILTVTHNAFMEDTDYCVFVNGTDISDPGNALVMEVFCFRTYSVTVPYIGFTAPVGGEVWSGGSDHDVTWNMGENGTMDAFVWLNYSCGGSEFPIDEGLMSHPTKWTQPYPWTVPSVDFTDCYLIGVVQDLDDHLKVTDTSGVFEIDSTDPDVDGTDPMDQQQDVPLDADVVITFSEGMDTSSAEGAFTMVIQGDTTAIVGAFSWDILNEIMTFNPTADLQQDTTYEVTIDTTACDDSDPGNCLATDYVFTFTTVVVGTPPTVAFLTPVTGDIFGPGQSVSITWNMTDAETAKASLTVDMELQYSNNTPISTVPAADGTESYAWTASCPVSGAVTTVVLWINVTDEHGMYATDFSDTFSIDCQPPTGAISGPVEEDEGKDVTFTITGASEAIATYSWNFGDSGTSTDASPTYKYDDPGDYTVTCTITDAYGNSGPATQHSITIKEVEEVDFLAQYWWIILIIIIVVILVIILLLAKRKKPEEEEEAPMEEEEYEEEEPEEEMEYEEEEVVEEEPEFEEEAAPAAAAAAEPAEEAPAGETKECPSCGTVVPADATECFLCGATL